MATVSSSSFDVQSLASQYVQADRAKMDSYFSSQQTYYKNRLSAYNAISTQLTAFQDAVSKLSGSDAFKDYGVTQSDDSYASITADSNAVEGQYQLHVSQLASADQYALDFASETSTVGNSGTLTLALGSDSFSIDMSKLPAGATVADLRNAINGASDNTGIKASLVRTGTSVKLMLTSEKTGADNAMSISTDGDPALGGLDTAIAGKSQLSKAQDAIVQLGADQSLTISSDSNTLDNVIDGLTIDLKKVQTDPSETITFSVGRDMDATKKDLNSFIDAYNTLIDTIKKYTTAADGQSPTLSGDSTSRMLQGQVRTLLNGADLSSMGIKSDRYGKLSLDEDKLGDYLEANPSGLNQVLGNKDGLMDKLDTMLDSYVNGSDSVFKTTISSTQANLDRLGDRMDAFDLQMQQQYNRYVSQFTQMQTIVSQMQQTSGLFG
ncbi:MAG: flagellar filament capping protein FliD [Pseudomonadota bacterium]|uniref:flagellar filament capping protein FliD n=1 Tax=Gallaecimonas pentaromativorans TaxID=584787 RepID=UPI00067EC26D|nr:flagellar filament capping protein FliD [Gallaecimonas pentaromativorans]MED5526547.1 flagellar filament capping protein FliD [Pseudomonadota bacterium]